MHNPTSMTAARDTSPLGVGLATLALAGLALMGLVTFSGTHTGADDRLGFHVALGCCLACMTLMFVSVYRASRDAMHPVCLTLAFMGLLFPFHGIVAHDNMLVLDRLGADRYDAFAAALLVVGVGAIAVGIGYRSGLARSMARLLPDRVFAIEDAHPTILPKLAVLYGIATASRAVSWITGLHLHQTAGQVSAGTMGRYQFLLHTAEQLAPAVTLFLLASGIARKNTRLVALGAGLLALEVIWGFTSGSRLEMLAPIALATIVIGRVRRHPWRLRHLLFAGIFFLFVAFPLVTSFRMAFEQRTTDIQREGVTSSIVLDALTDVFEDTDRVRPRALSKQYPRAVEAAAERLHGLTSLALVMRHTPERHDYLLGAHYAMIPINIIVPRFMWPSKPKVGRLAGVFKERYWGQVRDQDTSIGVSQLGDLWINFHLLGVLVGSFLFGAFLCFLCEHLRMGGEGSVFRYVVYGLTLFPALMGLEGTIDQTAAGLIKLMIVFWVLSWFLSPGSGRRGSPMVPGTEGAPT